MRRQQAAAAALAAVLVAALGWTALAPVVGSATAETAETVDSPVPRSPVSVAASADAAKPDAAKVAAALGPLVGAAALGGHVAVRAEAADGTVLFRSGDTAATPASTTKLLTALAALQALGAEHRFATTVVRSGSDVVLVGGGDPLLGTDEVAQLATQTALALRQAGVGSVGVRYDTGLFAGPGTAATWGPDYVSSGVVDVITALSLREDKPGRSDPAVDAVQAFAAGLVAAGIQVTGAPVAGKAPSGAAQVAVVHSATVGSIVEHTLEYSDNFAAEALGRQVAIAQRKPATFDGAAAAILAVDEALGVPTDGVRLYDASGLSHSDRIPVATLLAALRTSAAKESLRGLLVGLPVAGFTGTLGPRFDASPAGMGRVRAKTGSLTGVRALAGVATTADGTTVYFAALADDVTRQGDAEKALDALVAALSSCDCG